MNKRVPYLFWIFCAFSVPAFALVTYNFTGITNNIAGDVDIGETQLFLDVEDPGSNQVLFTFRNEGPEDSSIARIYVDDDGYLSGLDSIDDSDSGVSFSPGANPPDLPGGNQPHVSFDATTALSASSDPPTQPNGVNPGESVGLYYDLSAGQTYTDITSAITNGDLRVGIHVIGFESGGSESFVTTVIPAPGALILGSIGSLAVAALRTMKNRKN